MGKDQEKWYNAFSKLVNRSTCSSYRSIAIELNLKLELNLELVIALVEQ